MTEGAEKIQVAARQPSPRVNSLALAGSDALALLFSFGVGILGLLWYGNYFGNAKAFEQWMWEVGAPQAAAYSFSLLLVLINFWFQGNYHKRQPFWDELLAILRTLFYVSLSHGAVVLVAKWPLSRFVWLSSWLGAGITLPLFRAWTRRILRAQHNWLKPTVILGVRTNALDAYSALMSEPSMGFSVIGFLAFQPTTQELPAPQQGVTPGNLLPTLKALGSPHLVLALEREELQQNPELTRELTLRYPAFSWIPDVSGLPLLGMDISHFFSHEVLLLNVRNNLGNVFARGTKRLMDIVLSALAIVGLSPLLAYLTWKIRRTDGPAVFSHLRVGRNGQTFHCYKFRTMVPNAEQLLKELLARDPEARAEWDREFKLKKDPRITPVGAFLRKSSLDELPQLWNVLKGDMSLVGPRPVTAKELEKYGLNVDYYTAARPGITGLWQVSGRNEISYEARTNLDAWYVKNWNLWYDIAILFKTIRVVFGRKGAY